MPPRCIYLDKHLYLTPPNFEFNDEVKTVNTFIMGEGGFEYLCVEVFALLNQTPIKRAVLNRIR